MGNEKAEGGRALFRQRLRRLREGGMGEQDRSLPAWNRLTCLKERNRMVARFCRERGVIFFISDKRCRVILIASLAKPRQAETVHPASLSTARMKGPFNLPGLGKAPVMLTRQRLSKTTIRIVYSCSFSVLKSQPGRFLPETMHGHCRLRHTCVSKLASLHSGPKSGVLKHEKSIAWGCNNVESES